MINGKIRKQDILLLKVLVCVLIAVFFISVLIFPAIEKYQDLDLTKTEAQTQKDAMQTVIDSTSSNQMWIEKYQDAVEKIKTDYYDPMENSEIDALVTGLALDHDLLPVYLNISDSEDGVPSAYFLAQDAASTAMGGIGIEDTLSEEEELDMIDASSVTDATTADSSGAGTSNANSSDADTSAGSASGTQGSIALYQATAVTYVNLTLEGSEREVWAFLDDIAKNYPAIQVKSFKMDTDSYVDDNYQTVTAYRCSCMLAIYTCEEPETAVQ